MVDRQFLSSILELRKKVWFLPHGINESETKTILVESFFVCMNYHTRSIRQEYFNQGGIADYVLFDYQLFSSRPLIVLECKRVGTYLAKKDKDQLSRYFNNIEGVQMGILTNGIEYKFYTSHHGKMKETPFFYFDLSNINIIEIDILQSFRGMLSLKEAKYRCKSIFRHGINYEPCVYHLNVDKLERIQREL